jgi:WD40 repeat protein
MAVLPDGRVVSGSEDKTLRVWDVASEQTLATVYGDASFYSVAVVSQHLIVASDALGNIWFIDLPELAIQYSPGTRSRVG